MDILILIISLINTLLILLTVYYFLNNIEKSINYDKKIIIRKKIKHYIWMTILIIIVVILLLRYYPIVKDIFSTLLFSVILAYLLNPLVNIIEKKGLKRVWAVAAVYLVFAIALSIIFMSIIPKIVEEFKNLARVLPSYINQIYDIFNKKYIKYTKNINNLPAEFIGIREAIIENFLRIQNIITDGTKRFANSIISGFSKIVTFILIPILAFYFIKDKEYFTKKIYFAIPKEYRKDVGKVSREIDVVLGKFIRGQLIVAAFVGITTSIGLFILRIDFALIIGLVAGIAEIIPYFGPIIGIIPAIIFALLESPSKAVWVIILFVIIQQIEGNIVTPKIVGESVGIHPVIVIIILLIGGSLFGILGMLLAIPFVAIIKVIVSFIVEKITDI